MSSKFTVDVFNAIALDSAIRQIRSDFQLFLEGYLPTSFGRDEVYDRPEEIIPHELKHIHLLKPDNPTYGFRDPYYRVSDHSLVYTRGKSNRNAYLLLAILEPPAHEAARDYNLMRFYATIAAEFRKLN